ncbi:5609_t:CDS:2, partial [Entrophospora sp. SA101]
MPRIYTLSDISEGNKLGGIPSSRYPPNRIELENQLACANRDRKIAIECGNQLVNKCSVLDKDNKRIQRDLKQSNKDKEKLSKHTYQLIEEVKRLSSELDSLISQITRKDISLNESKIKIKDLQSRIKILETKLSSTQNESKEITALRSMKKILEGKLSSAQKDVISIQNDSLKKESENLSLKSKIAELDHIKSSLESKVNELEHLKSEAISKPIVGGNDEKNTQSEEQSSISNSSNISADRNLSQYFIHKKNMNQAGKIDTMCLESKTLDTEIIPEVSDEIDISKTNNNTLQEIPNMTPYLAQPENNMSSLIESNTQMGPGPEALPLSAVASTLMSPLSAYICLILLIIAVIWFVVLRRTWGLERKNERLRDACKEPSSPLYTDCIVTHSFMVVGMRFRGGHKFKKSDTITLEPEPSNTYDKNAIKIMVDGIHKAYVAKDEN